MTIYRTQVVSFHDERYPDAPEMAAPPAVPCAVTRCEVVVSPAHVAVHVWLAARADGDDEGVWDAPDGTRWLYSGGNIAGWTGWQPGEDGTWFMSRADFRRVYPSAPDWDRQL